MRTSTAGLDLIKQFEGCKLTAYKALPSEQYYTIGYGHYGPDIQVGFQITQEIAEILLQQDLEKYEARVNKYSKYNWTQNEFDALVSFAYNIGSIDQLTQKGTRSKKEIAEKMLLYYKSGGKKIQGLVKRRQAEHDLFTKGSTNTKAAKTIMVGSARIDEKGKAKGGAAGDQTGKEVCTQAWYKNGWNVLIRCKDPDKAEVIARSCEAGCSNPAIGYDQNQRNTLRTQAQAAGYDLSKITKACETDCSAFASVCAECAGIMIPYNGLNAPTTRTMRNAFKSTGEFEILTESKYLNSPDLLKRGDILVKEGAHTVIVL